MLQDELTQMINRGKFTIETFLHGLDFLSDHLILRKVKYLLTQQFQNLHIILTQYLRSLGRSHEIGDEGWPIVRPFLFEDLDQGEVEFG